MGNFFHIRYIRNKSYYQKLILNKTDFNIYELTKLVYDEIKPLADTKKIEFEIDCNDKDIEINIYSQNKYNNETESINHGFASCIAVCSICCKESKGLGIPKDVV